MIDVESLHRRAPVADAHADTLMWNRDLNRRDQGGHVDFPRLADAGVKLQCFTVVTRGFPIIDGFGLFARQRGWPVHALGGPWARALWQMDRLSKFCLESKGRATVTTTAAQLEANLAAGRLSAILGIEGAHALESRIERVAELHVRGVRFMSLTHLAPNELGSSSFPIYRDRGLTPLGHQVVEAMASVGMTVDLAHASRRTLADLLAHRDARVFCSHTGVAGAASNWRNLTDDVLRAVAERGGVVGIIFAPIYLGGSSVADVARHIEHAVNVMGEDGVGLGSDFDGMVSLPKGMRGVSQLPLITRELLSRGHPEARVEKIIGGNLRRFFAETL